MAKRTTRDKYKRKIQQAIGHIDTIQGVLSQMFLDYHELHPEISIQLALLLEALDEIRNALIQFNSEF